MTGKRATIDERGAGHMSRLTVGQSVDSSPEPVEGRRKAKARGRFTVAASSQMGSKARGMATNSRGTTTKPHGVIPPTSKSIATNGALKDTPANRALSPRVAPQQLFESRAFTRPAYFADASSIVFHGDVREELRRIAATGVKVDCIVTSPPFYGQRDYGIEGQLGLEDHPRPLRGDSARTARRTRGSIPRRLHPAQHARSRYRGTRGSAATSGPVFFWVGLSHGSDDNFDTILGTLYDFRRYGVPDHDQGSHVTCCELALARGRVPAVHVAAR